MEPLSDKDTVIEIPISDEAPAVESAGVEENVETNVAPEAAEAPTLATAATELAQETDEKFKRLAADFANYKRRAEAERNELMNLLEARLLNGILGIYDDFCRLSQHTAGVNEQLAQGLKAVQTKWQAWLSNENVEVISPAGQAFDPHFHDALMQQPVRAAEQDGRVIYVIENGYQRRDKVLRHAKVIVGHYEAAPATAEAETEAQREEGTAANSAAEPIAPTTN